jgi:hypothetical protein
MSVSTTFTAGLSAIAAAESVAVLDRVRRSVADHGQAGRLNADQVAALAAVCRARALELAERDAAAPAPVVMTLAAAAPAPKATTGSVADGDYNATIAQASEREWPDSGLVLSVVVACEIDGEVADVRARFTGDREVARKAMFRAAGLPSGAAVEQLIGKAVRVELSTWAPPGGGSPRPVVRRWLAPAAPAPAAPRAPSVVKGCNTAKPPKSSKPAWESDSDIPF